MKCPIPVFEDLLPSPHNRIILNLLFILCMWHAYAKLRLHTTSTISFLNKTTQSLGFVLWKFSKRTCSAFQTNELPKEEAARACWKAKTATAKAPKSKSLTTTSKRGQAGKSNSESNSNKKSETQQNRLKKTFSLFTYKLSALGEYLWAILLYGMTDGYSTQIVWFIFFQAWGQLIQFILTGRTWTSTCKALLCKNQQNEDFCDPNLQAPMSHIHSPLNTQLGEQSFKTKFSTWFWTWPTRLRAEQ